MTSPSLLVMDGLFCTNGEKSAQGRLGGGSGHGSEYPSGSTDFWFGGLTDGQAS